MDHSGASPCVFAQSATWCRDRRSSFRKMCSMCTAGRADRDHELLRDLPIAVPTADQPHDVTLAGSEHTTWPTEFIARRGRRRVECHFDLVREDLEWVVRPVCPCLLEADVAERCTEPRHVALVFGLTER